MSNNKKYPSILKVIKGSVELSREVKFDMLVEPGGGNVKGC